MLFLILVFILHSVEVAALITGVERTSDQNEAVEWELLICMTLNCYIILE